MELNKTMDFIKMNNNENFFIKNNQVTIIIGENGSGKSTILKNIAKERISKKRHVIGIANTIYDKFNIKSQKFSFLGARQGRKITETSIKRALIESQNDSAYDLRKISNILKYIGYDAEIGIRLSGLNTEMLKYIDIDENLYKKQELFELLDLFELVPQIGQNTVIWLGMNNYNLQELKSSFFTRILRHEKILKKIKVLKSINVFLRKNDQEIELQNASSGELSFITTMIYISTVIKINSTILIDEPENSLHPKWQKEYLNKFLDLFYFYSPTIVIATHSPLIISGAENSKNSVNIYKNDGKAFYPIHHEDNDMESLLWELFEVITPENRFMSKFLIGKLNELSEHKISIHDVRDIIADLIKSSYDERQTNTLQGILEIANKINRRAENV